MELYEKALGFVGVDKWKKINRDKYALLSEIAFYKRTIREHIEGPPKWSGRKFPLVLCTMTVLVGTPLTDGEIKILNSMQEVIKAFSYDEEFAGFILTLDTSCRHQWIEYTLVCNLEEINAN